MTQEITHNEMSILLKASEKLDKLQSSLDRFDERQLTLFKSVDFLKDDVRKLSDKVVMMETQFRVEQTKAESFVKEKKTSMENIIVYIKIIGVALIVGFIIGSVLDDNTANKLTSAIIKR